MVAVGDLPGIAAEPAVCGDGITDDPASGGCVETSKMEKVAMGITLAMSVVAGHADSAGFCRDRIQAVVAGQFLP